MTSVEVFACQNKSHLVEDVPSCDDLSLVTEGADDFEDINIVKLLSQTRFPVYLAFSPSINKKFALKLFEFKNSKPNRYFKNEARFAPLSHQNVIQVVHTEEKIAMATSQSGKNFSCILSEFAPNGDFFDFVKKHKQHLTEKLIRTYFRQLIEGISYLHKNGVHHLDIKLENLLIGEDYQLKIADFDLSYVVGDPEILAKGTKFYRAPELKACKCTNSAAADIYSAGVILFVLKSGGVVPHAEDHLFEGIDLFNLLNNDSEEFFKKHTLIQERGSSFFDANFKELFLGMTKQNPKRRMTLDEIKNTKWYKGTVYTKEEFAVKMKKILGN